MNFKHLIAKSILSKTNTITLYLAQNFFSKLHKIRIKRTKEKKEKNKTKRRTEKREKLIEQFESYSHRQNPVI